MYVLVDRNVKHWFVIVFFSSSQTQRSINLETKSSKPFRLGAWRIDLRTHRAALHTESTQKYLYAVIRYTSSTFPISFYFDVLVNYVIFVIYALRFNNQCVFRTNCSPFAIVINIDRYTSDGIWYFDDDKRVHFTTPARAEETKRVISREILLQYGSRRLLIIAIGRIIYYEWFETVWTKLHRD